MNDTGQVRLITTSQASGSGIIEFSSIIIDLTDLGTDAEYGIQIASGVVSDTEGNTYIGDSDALMLNSITKQSPDIKTPPLLYFF